MKNVGPLDKETVIDVFLATGPQKAIAWKYGISQRSVSHIKSRHNYRQFTEAYDPNLGATRMNATLISAAFGVLHGPA